MLLKAKETSLEPLIKQQQWIIKTYLKLLKSKFNKVSNTEFDIKNMCYKTYKNTFFFYIDDEITSIQYSGLQSNIEAKEKTKDHISNFGSPKICNTGLPSWRHRIISYTGLVPRRTTGTQCDPMCFIECVRSIVHWVSWLFVRAKQIRIQNCFESI